MEVNSDLEAKVLAKIEAGWWLFCGGVWRLAMCRNRVGSLAAFLPFTKDAKEVPDCDIVAAHRPAILADVSLATAFKFGEPDTMTRDEARGLYVEGARVFLPQLAMWMPFSLSIERDFPLQWYGGKGLTWNDATHIRNPGDPYNCWRIEEEKT